VTLFSKFSPDHKSPAQSGHFKAKITCAVTHPENTFPQKNENAAPKSHRPATFEPKHVKFNKNLTPNND
jgi:hypothetical protein